MLARKGYDNHYCHNKPLDRKCGWSVDDVMPGWYGPENLRILKKSQLKVDIGPWKTRVECSTIATAVKIFGSLPKEIINPTRCTAHGDGVSKVRIVSLSSCRRTKVKKLINAFVSEQQSPPVFAYACLSLYLNLHMDHWIDIITIIMYTCCIQHLKTLNCEQTND